LNQVDDPQSKWNHLRLIWQKKTIPKKPIKDDGADPAVSWATFVVWFVSRFCRKRQVQWFCKISLSLFFFFFSFVCTGAGLAKRRSNGGGTAEGAGERREARELVAWALELSRTGMVGTVPKRPEWGPRGCVSRNWAKWPFRVSPDGPSLGASTPLSYLPAGRLSCSLLWRPRTFYSNSRVFRWQSPVYWRFFEASRLYRDFAYGWFQPCCEGQLVLPDILERAGEKVRDFSLYVFECKEVIWKSLTFIFVIINIYLLLILFIINIKYFLLGSGRSIFSLSIYEQWREGYVLSWTSSSTRKRLQYL
jgi:hypothetical protein